MFTDCYSCRFLFYRKKSFSANNLSVLFLSVFPFFHLSLLLSLSLSLSLSLMYVVRDISIKDAYRKGTQMPEDICLMKNSF